MTPARPQESSAPPGPRFAAPGIDDVYIVAVLGVIFIATLGAAVTPNDFWFHIATARETVAGGQIPTRDAFSFTRGGEPFFNQGWLAQLSLYGLYRLGGLELVVLVYALVITAAVGFLVALCRELGGSKRLTAIAVALVALPLAAPNFGVRPQALAFLLFALLLWAVWGARHRAMADPCARTRRIWIALPVVLLWANVHGSFPLAVCVIAAVAAGDVVARRWGKDAPPPSFDRRLLIAGAASVLVSFINPAGWRVWAYVAELGTSPVIGEFVMEWQSPSMGDGMGAAFFAAVLGVGAALAIARRRPDPAEALLGAGFFLLAASALRHTGWFGFVAAALVAGLLAGRLPDRPPWARGNKALNVAIVALLAGLAALALPWVRPHFESSPVASVYGAHTPVAAVRALRDLDEPPSRLFHEVGYGSYLTWARPDEGVFIDPRFELYPARMWRDYVALSGGYDTARLLSRYRIDGVLADRELQIGLVRALGRDPAWELVYEDEVAALFLPAD